MMSTKVGIFIMPHMSPMSAFMLTGLGAFC